MRQEEIMRVRGSRGGGGRAFICPSAGGGDLLPVHRHFRPRLESWAQGPCELRHGGGIDLAMRSSLATYPITQQGADVARQRNRKGRTGLVAGAVVAALLAVPATPSAGVPPAGNGARVLPGHRG